MLKTVFRVLGRWAAGLVATAALALLALQVGVRAWENRPRPHVPLPGQSCNNSMKAIGLMLEIYAKESPDSLYPALSKSAGALIFDPALMYPEFMPAAVDIICPEDKEHEEARARLLEMDRHTSKEGFDLSELIDDYSYFYLGYAVLNDADMEAFAKAYRTYLGRGETLTQDLVIASDNGARTIRRLREGVEDALIADGRLPSEMPQYYVSIVPGEPSDESLMRSIVPVLIERVDHHESEGGNVLYLDGHVEFVEYPGKWPMTETTVRIFNELDALWDAAITPEL